VAGAGAAMVMVGGQVVLADITTPANRGRMMAIYMGVFLFAVGIGPLPGGLLAERHGLAAPFYVYAVAGAVAAVVAWWSIPETRHRGGGAAVTGESLAAFGGQLRLLTGRLGFMLVSLITFMSAVARTGALFNIIPVVARDRLGLDADQIGLGLALASLAGLLVIYPSGMLVDRIGRKAVIVPGTLMAATAMVLFVLAPSYGWFLAACVAWSLASGVGGAAPAAYAADVAPPGMNAAAMSAYRMLSDVGYVVGPLALGVITDLFGANTALITAAILLAAVATLFARLAPEAYRPRG
jgi:MFS family permease